MTDHRRPSTRSWPLLALLAGAFHAAGAQTPPLRLELAASGAPAAPVTKPGESVVVRSFVRDQTVLGFALYGPSFAASLANEPVAYAAAYLVAGGGSWVAARQLSASLTINEPTSWLATQTALRGAFTGWAIAVAADANRHNRAGGVFLGSLAGAAGAVALGRGMTDGEVAASVFGSDLAGLTGLAATHVARPGALSRSRAGATAGAALLGYPLGYWYARSAPYRVSPGDVNTLWTGAAIGALASGAFIASGDPSARTVAATLGAGALAGTVLADRFLVRPYDHTPADGQFVALGAAAGGLMGAGIAILSGAAHDRVSTATAALTAAGAVGGVAFIERWRAPLREGERVARRGGAPARAREGARAASRLALVPGGAPATLLGATGTHTILAWTF